MPPKKDYYQSYGQKLISLFARLLFSNRPHSLIELARILNCSKQTVMRLANDIRRAYGVEIEETMRGRRKYYRLIKRSRANPGLNLSESEFIVLQMCRSFTRHLLGRQLFEEASRALEKSISGRAFASNTASEHFASFIPGSIDYTDHHLTLTRLIKAMDRRKICKLTYRKIMAEESKTYYIKPLKLFSQKETIYLHARMARKPGAAYKKPKFDPLLAVHRIVAIEQTGRSFEYPRDYDFETVFNQNFGVIKEKAFEVATELTGFAASFVAERIWSPDQTIEDNQDGSIRLTFKTSSAEEFIAWVLSYGEEARVLEPDWMVREVAERVRAMNRIYSDSTKGNSVKIE